MAKPTVPAKSPGDKFLATECNNIVDSIDAAYDLLAGGTTGQVLTKNSDAAYDVSFSDGTPGPAGTDGTDGTNGVGVPVGGTAGQVLSKVDGTDFNTHWVDETAGSGDMLSANNLSDVASMNTSRQNLGFQTVWNRKGVVLAPSAINELTGLGEQTVIYDTNPVILTTCTNVYKMWYGYGWTTAYIGYAESSDGVTWIRYNSNPIISNHNRGFVFKNGSTYIMYCSPVANIAIDQYTSTDGVTWTLAHASVITAAALGVDGVYSPCVFIEGGVWKMMVDIGTGSPSIVFSEYYLTSPDGVVWTSHAGNPIIPYPSFSEDPYIIKDGGIYYMFGHSGQQWPSDIYMTTSTDMVTWTTPVLMLKRRSFDEGALNDVGQIGDVSVLQVDNSIYLYYKATTNGGLSTAFSPIKLAIANMTLQQLAETSQGDGGDIIVEQPPFDYNPISKTLSYTGGNAATLILNALTNAYLQFTSNGAEAGVMGCGISVFLPAPTDFSIIQNGSGNMSIESANLYLNPTSGNTYLPKSLIMGLPTAAAYGTFIYVTTGFYQQSIYNTSHELFISNAGNKFISPQNPDDIVFSSTDNICFSTVTTNDQVDCYAEFNKANKSLILNGGNEAGFTPDTSAILQLDNTAKGFLPPRMTTAQRLAISSPAEGLNVYDLTTHKQYVWDGSVWQALW